MTAPDWVKLFYMAADPADADRRADKLLQGVECRDAGPFLDGPVHRRLAVVDLDPVTGALRPGPALQPPKGGRTMARYAIANPLDPDSPGFRPVSVFATVWETMQMFEERDVLGRPLQWAFDGEQLLIVPEAGVQANAFYHRASRSLQFFSFDRPGPGGAVRRAHTCLSPDIVAHEATHAILDGIAPDLYDAAAPQSLALHEAMADLAAVVFAVRTRLLRVAVLERTRSDLRQSGAFSGIAQELGGVGAGDNAGHPLRDLANDLTLRPEGPAPASNGPHDLCLVLTGAMYALFLHVYARAQAKATGREDWALGDVDAASFSASGLSIVTAADVLKRVAFRALDYLPPGEVSFADYARAVLAADAASNPGDGWLRDFLVAEFVRRGIVDSAEELLPVPHRVRLPRGLDLTQLVESDWVAWRWAETNRRALMVPKGVPFEVRPRLSVTKSAYRKGNARAETHEVLVKVAWTADAPGDFGPLGLGPATVTQGTTVVIDRETRRVRAVLSTGAAHPSQAHGATARNAAMRVAYVRSLAEEGLLRPGQVQMREGRLKLRGMAQMLHMAGERE